jgi:hypothetical protein
VSILRSSGDFSLHEHLLHRLFRPIRDAIRKDLSHVMELDVSETSGTKYVDASIDGLADELR